MNKKNLSKVMSELAKLSHKKHPRPKEYYSNIANKRWSKVIHTPSIDPSTR